MTKADHRKLLDGIIAQLKGLRADLHNRSPLRGKRSAPRTSLVRKNIVKLYRGGLSQQQVAHRLNISIGRVSETLRGKRR